MKITQEYVAELFDRPLLDLVFEAARVHRENHNPREVQLCTLLSIKTGGCPEDCAYCPQAARYSTGLDKELLLQVDQVLQAAQRAKDAGSTRFCMGAAWREVQDGKGFDRVIEMVKGVRAMGLEVCTTLGMVTPDQAVRLKEAGVYAYNHNLDTSREHYDDIITTRTYDDRLNTLKAVSDAGISVCCGGIIGMGEEVIDRVKLLWQIANLNPQPESVPINALVPVAGTPLGDKARDEGLEKIDPLEWIRTIAVARILMPKAMVRLSAGRMDIPESAQAMAFLAGANSIFTGDKLLTTANPDFDIDKDLLDKLGLHGRAAYKDEEQPAAATTCATKTGGACGCASSAAA